MGKMGQFLIEFVSVLVDYFVCPHFDVYAIPYRPASLLKLVLQVPSLTASGSVVLTAAFYF
jgi:hypothetical protein